MFILDVVNHVKWWVLWTYEFLEQSRVDDAQMTNIFVNTLYSHDVLSASYVPKSIKLIFTQLRHGENGRRWRGKKRLLST